MSHFVVIGGGIAGLAAANVLAKAGSVTLLEQSRELGGRARTLCIDGYLLNLGSHALITDGIAARTFRDWGIQFSGGDPAQRSPDKRAVVVRDGILHPAVNNFTSLIKSRMFSLGEKLELAKLLSRMTHNDASESESVNDWLSRRVRSECVRQYILDGVANGNLQFGVRSVECEGCVSPTRIYDQAGTALPQWRVANARGWFEALC